MKIWIPIIVVAIFSITVISISAEESLIPSWIKSIAGFWANDQISDQEFIAAIEWMLENKVIKVSSTDDGEWKAEADKLYKENQRLKADIKRLENDISMLFSDNFEYSQIIPEQQKQAQPQPAPDYSEYCYGTASCFGGYVTEVIDGDTIKVDGESIRFSLVDTPEYGEAGYTQARKFIEQVCPVGSFVLVDEDDFQTQGSYGRMIALIWCQKSNSENAINLNEQVLGAGLAEITTYFCSKSEFEYTDWAQRYGCGDSYYEQPETKYEPPKSSSQTTQSNCDPSYPTVCIPPYPPDLDCGEISYRNFKVLPPDPHRFDRDKDGIGCES